MNPMAGMGSAAAAGAMMGLPGMSGALSVHDAEPACCGVILAAGSLTEWIAAA
jgi:hypothetical protein